MFRLLFGIALNQMRFKAEITALQAGAVVWRNKAKADKECSLKLQLQEAAFEPAQTA